MKKIKLLAIIATIFVANIAVADVPVIKIIDIHKEGGRNMFWGLCEPRYSTVTKTSHEYFKQDIASGTIVLVERISLTCLDPGWAKCRLSVAENRINYNGVNINENIFIENANDLMDQVDKNLEKSIFSGKTTKKVTVKASGKQFLFLFEATWQNGNENGDADIEIKVSDITAYSTVIAGSANGAAVSIR